MIVRNDDTENDEPTSRTWEVDSALGEEQDSDDLESTHSIASSILNYTYENGRRYHAFRAGQYFMPNDEVEQDGMDLMHHVSLMILGGELHRAPLNSPQSILELGTGTGIWAMEAADKFPGAHVIATDLSPIQPNWVPPNLEFQVDDCESPWCFNRAFDFIHMRNLSGSIADWPKLLSECYNHLKPGGWIEVSNIEAWGYSYNDVLPHNSAPYKWQNNLKTAADAVGRELNIAPQLRTLLSRAGFSNPVDDSFMIPMSGWDPNKTDLARSFQYLVFMELEALSLRLYTGVLGWTREELHTLLVDVRKEIRNPANQMFSTMHYVYAQKPMD